jgi:hypothetical protein
MKMRAVCKIDGLPLKYRGFTIWQDTESIPVKHPFNPSLDYDQMVYLSNLCISKDAETPFYNPEFTKKKTLLGGFGLVGRKFKTIKSAKKEIDTILSLGHYWMELTPRETEYVKEQYRKSLDIPKTI